MKTEHFGTEYGGWHVYPDLIPADGLIIDGGVGTDVSFAAALKERKPGLRFIGVDHMEDSEKFCKDHAPKDYRFIRAALVGPGAGGPVAMYRNPKQGSESHYGDHNFVNAQDVYQVPSVDLAALVREYKPCLVKLDIEGAEYEVYQHCFGVPQVCMEVHHRMMRRYTAVDTLRMAQEFTAHGYVVAHMTKTDEFLFVLAELLVR